MKMKSHSLFYDNDTLHGTGFHAVSGNGVRRCLDSRPRLAVGRRPDLFVVTPLANKLVRHCLYELVTVKKRRRLSPTAGSGRQT